MAFTPDELRQLKETLTEGLKDGFEKSNFGQERVYDDEGNLVKDEDEIKKILETREKEKKKTAKRTAIIKGVFDIANEIAPEHLEILTENPLEKLSKVKNAGSIFLGENAPEPLGDYMSGTNHVLPTGGTAKFYSSLGVYDFVKYSSFSYYTKEVLETFKDDVIEFANLEGLDAHANSIRVRFED
jgi:histidinol dehydrogenase